ncbi:MAG TPA: TonB-dependent receptor [Steroidobacteraceae bacterium]
MPQSRRLKQTQASILRRGLPVASGLIAAVPVAYAQQSTTAGGLEEIIVTAQKREESLQNVPLSIQAIDSTKLEQLQVKEFTDYVKYMPSVSYTSLGPGFSLPYFRGVASGENNNHSGPQPSVGMYLDEQPITTIQGALDIHMYDIARVEALAGPQGTLYGASSQAGTIRIITNKPDPSAFASGYGLEVNSVEHGGMGYVAEGFVNLPISNSAAVRLVGWARHDAGYIDNVAAERVYQSTGACISNRKNPPAGCVSTQEHPEDDFNDVDTYGARAALKIDLNDNWSVTPQVMGQKQEAKGAFWFDAGLDELEIAHFYPDTSEDKFVQGALTVEGRIGNFDLVYAGAYLKREDEVDADYSDYTFWYDECCSYVGLYWGDSVGDPLPDPSQYIDGSDAYKRWSHELRISSPREARVRFVGGLFYQDQEHEIFQNYQVTGLGGYLSDGEFFSIVDPNWPNTLWLTNQLRKDEDKAVFGELSFDFTEQLTATVGARYFETENSIRGFFGFMSENYSSNYGVAKCEGVPQPANPYKGSPCENINDSIDDSGSVFKGNLTYRFTDDKLMYATYSEGFRPGGINRNNTVEPYKPDYLYNYEIGWKTTWLDNTLRFNGAIFHEKWDDIQYSFLPPGGSGLTVIRNAGGAEIDGIEADLTWAAPFEGLTVSGGFSWLDAKMTDDYVPGRDDDPPNLTPEAFEGDRLPVTPEFKANLTARFQFDLGGRSSFAQAGAVYNSDTYSDLTRFDRETVGKNPSYTLVDLSTGMNFGSLAVELYVNNVFDEIGQNSAFVGCATDTCGPQPYYAPAQPRTIGLKISQEF